MADTSSATQNTITNPSSPPRTMNSIEPPSPGGRGRGRGRGQRGPRGGRSGGRGRGRGGHNQHQFHQSDTGPDQSYGRPPGGSFGGRLTEAAQTIQGDARAPAKDTQTDDENAVAEDIEVCFICASPIEHTAIAPCNHQTCHICALRLRALYKTRACAHCRVGQPHPYYSMKLTPPRQKRPT